MHGSMNVKFIHANGAGTYAYHRNLSG